MLGTDESHQHHRVERPKKKVRHTQTVKPQTEGVICSGADTAFPCCGQCLLLNSVCYPALALPSDTLAGTDTMLLLSAHPCLSERSASNCMPFFHSLTTRWSLRNAQQQQAADTQTGKSVGRCTFTLKKIFLS